ncbi:diguanylate cyclase [Algiphilus sp.]|uniref:diguanylate cyclase domain-containing protein n=1 Tax=Algiphilus sp. TaxID=1872431 RepID=UPI0032ED7D66
MRTIRLPEPYQDEPGIAISVGMAAYPADGMSQSELLAAADAALYAAKRRGRNQVVIAVSESAQTVEDSASVSPRLVKGQLAS